MQVGAELLWYSEYFLWESDVALVRGLVVATCALADHGVQAIMVYTPVTENERLLNVIWMQ